jgi:hypothetical protein
MPLFVREAREDLFAIVNHALQAIPRGSVPSGVTTARYSTGLDRDLSATG